MAELHPLIFTLQRAKLGRAKDIIHREMSFPFTLDSFI